MTRWNFQPYWRCFLRRIILIWDCFEYHVISVISHILVNGKDDNPYYGKENMFETTNQILMIMRVYHVPIRHWAIKTHFQERAIMRSKPSCPKPIFPRKLLYQWYPPTSTQTCQRVGTHGIFSTEAQSRPLPSFGFPEASPPGRIIVLGVPRV